jgi:hypothetical protein
MIQVARRFQQFEKIRPKRKRINMRPRTSAFKLAPFDARAGYLAITGVGVEKVPFPEIRLKLGDRKCMLDRRKSFIGHPSATIFQHDLRE